MEFGDAVRRLELYLLRSRNRGLFVFAGILLLAAAGVFSAVHNAIG
jgi:hypothetical protein